MKNERSRNSRLLVNDGIEIQQQHSGITSEKKWPTSFQHRLIRKSNNAADGQQNYVNRMKEKVYFLHQIAQDI